MIFTTKQLAAASGRSIRTIRHHVKEGWLTPVPKEELPKGVRGSRFKLSTAKKWLELHYPGKKLPS